MNDNNTILDKIIDSQTSQERVQFNPSEIVVNLLKSLSGKEDDVIRRRFGLSGARPQTLEEIGKQYQVTRERIRQIENTAILKIMKFKEFVNHIGPAEHVITSTFNQYGGVMEESFCLENLLSYCGDSETNRQSTVFILNNLLKDKYKSIKANQILRAGWKLKHISLDRIEKIVQAFAEIIEAKGETMDLNDVINEVKQSESFDNSAGDTDDNLLSYLKLAAQISQNPFEEFGMNTWGSIHPKRMNDKIMLILKKQHEPLHFNDIARLINEAKFDQRQAYPPTVHNELILNKEYVLVGRGIYALKEWGYQPGVVADVIERIIKDNSEPVSRQEIIDQVMKKRVVKKNTINLALTNKKKFKKMPDGRYKLAEIKEQ